jgi:hypothetical protein
VDPSGYIAKCEGIKCDEDPLGPIPGSEEWWKRKVSLDGGKTDNESNSNKNSNIADLGTIKVTGEHDGNYGDFNHDPHLRKSIFKQMGFYQGLSFLNGIYSSSDLRNLSNYDEQYSLYFGDLYGPNGDYWRFKSAEYAGYVSIAAKGAQASKAIAKEVDNVRVATNSSIGDELPEHIVSLAEANLAQSGKTVLGHFPGYIEKANKMKASFYDIGNAWDSLNDLQRWSANRHFLNKVAEQGDQVFLSVPKTKIRPDSYLKREVDYLINHKNYQWVNQWSLRKK